MLVAGFVLWSVVFVVLYAAQATGCRLGWHTREVFQELTLQRVVLVVLFLGAIALHIVLIGWFRHNGKEDARDAFTRRAARTLAAAALGASIFCFAGVLWLSAC